MISSIILAAGESTRMGRPKALLDWGGEPLLSYEVRQLREAGVDEVIVVLGAQADLIHREIRRAQCRVMLNPRYHAGRAGSLRIGAKASNRDADAILVMNVDQPRPADFLRQLLESHNPESAATIPNSNGHHGHPVVVSGRLRTELLEAKDEEQGLKGVLQAHEGELADVACDDLCQLDINTPDDYEAAKRRFGL